MRLMMMKCTIVVVVIAASFSQSGWCSYPNWNRSSLQEILSGTKPSMSTGKRFLQNEHRNPGAFSNAGISTEDFLTLAMLMFQKDHRFPSTGGNAPSPAASTNLPEFG